MAEKVTLFEADINIKEAVNDAKKLKEEIELLRSQTEKAKNDQGELSAEYIKYAASLKSAQTELNTQNKLIQQSILIDADRLSTTEQLALQSKELKKEYKSGIDTLVQLQLAGEKNSEQYKELVVRLGAVKDAMDGARQEVKLLSSDTLKIDQLVSVFGAAANAVQVYEGATQALGISNEDAQKGIQKLVAIQSALNGVQGLQNALQKESAFMLALNTAKTKIQAATQAIYTTAVGTSTGALKAFRTALLATGIGAIIAGIIALIANWDKLTEAFSKSSKEANKLSNELNSLKSSYESINGITELGIKAAKERGATEIELTQLEIKLNKDKQAQLNEEISILEKIQATGKATDEQKQSLQKAYTDLVTLGDEKILLGIRLKRIEEEKAAEEKIRLEKEVQEEIKKAQEKAAEIRKKQQEDKEKAEKEEIENAKKLLDETLKNLQLELDTYLLTNQSKLDGAKELTQSLIDEELRRQEEINTKEQESLQLQLDNKLISQEEYNYRLLEQDVAFRELRAELETQYKEEQDALKSEQALTEFEDYKELIDGQIFEELNLQRKLLDEKYKAEIAAANKIGVDTTNITKKYNKAKRALQYAEFNATLTLASSLTNSIAYIFGEQTKLGKLAAAASATVSAIQGGVSALTGMIEAIPGPVGIALGAVAAIGVLAAGYAEVKKIYAVNSGLPGDSGGGGGSMPSGGMSAISAPSVTASTVAPSVGAGIVSRNATDTATESVTAGVSQALSETPLQPTLVTDDVTLNQSSEMSKNKTSTL